MIELIHEENNSKSKKFWLKKDDIQTQHWQGCISWCSEKELLSLAERIFTKFGVKTLKAYMKEVEVDKKLFTQRLVPNMTAKIKNGKYVLDKVRSSRKVVATYKTLKYGTHQ